MEQGANKETRKEQKEILKELYADYNPIRHDVFVDRYNSEVDKKSLNDYMINRGIISENVETHYRNERTIC